MEIKNAVIESAKLTFEDNNILTIYIGLDYGGTGQSFGGYSLYLPKSFNHHSKNTKCGHFIYRLLEVAGVFDWDSLVGKNIRVKSDFSKIYEIGHIIKDDWFNPSEELEV